MQARDFIKNLHLLSEVGYFVNPKQEGSMKKDKAVTSVDAITLGEIASPDEDIIQQNVMIKEVEKKDPVNRREGYTAIWKTASGVHLINEMDHAFVVKALGHSQKVLTRHIQTLVQTFAKINYWKIKVNELVSRLEEINEENVKVLTELSDNIEVSIEE